MKYIKKYESDSISDYQQYLSSNQKFSSLSSFITWSDKRYVSKEYDNDDFLEIISILNEECGDFMKMVIDKNIKPIFRGVKNCDETYTRGLFTKSSRDDRRPVDTDKEVSNIIDSYFKDKYGIPIRTNGIFTSKLPTVASDYGNVYLFFPIGGFKYFWNPKISDLYGDIEGQDWYYNTSKGKYSSLELEQRWNYTFGEGSNGGLWIYDDIEYSSDIISTFKRVKEDNPELSSKSFEYIKKLLYWQPDVDFESYCNDISEKLHLELEKIVDNYQDYGISDVKEQEITFICDKYYLVDSGFYTKYVEYLKNKTLT